MYAGSTGALLRHKPHPVRPERGPRIEVLLGAGRKIRLPVGSIAGIRHRVQPAKTLNSVHIVTKTQTRCDLANCMVAALGTRFEQYPFNYAVQVGVRESQLPRTTARERSRVKR